eukprot:gene6970-10729_t
MQSLARRLMAPKESSSEPRQRQCYTEGKPWDHAGYVTLGGRLLRSGKRVWLELYGSRVLVFNVADQKPKEVWELEGAEASESGSGFVLSGKKLRTKKVTTEHREATDMWLRQLHLNDVRVVRKDRHPTSPVVRHPDNGSFDWVVVGNKEGMGEAIQSTSSVVRHPDDGSFD